MENSHHDLTMTIVEKWNGHLKRVFTWAKLKEFYKYNWPKIFNTLFGVKIQRKAEANYVTHSFGLGWFWIALILYWIIF